MIKAFLYLFVSFILLMSAYFNSEGSQRQKNATVNYLPLGDSYTIGTGATTKEAWPYLLMQHLNEQGVDCKLLDNPARNGFSTQDLIDRELPLLKTLKPNFVTVLIGVNDWVRGVSKAAFTENLIYILNEVQKELPDKTKLLLVTIPDFGVTPTGKNYSRGRNTRTGIAEFNEVIKEEAKKRKLKLVDIFETTQLMSSDNSLVASDGLHPSAKEYAIWEKMILPETIKLVK